MYNAPKDNHIAGAIAKPFLSTLFAIALLAGGQNSTITGTLTVTVMDFLRFRLPQWAVRPMTSDHRPSCHHRCDLIWRPRTCP